MEVSKKNFSTVVGVILYGLMLLLASVVFDYFPVISNIMFATYTVLFIYYILYVRQWSGLRLLIWILVILRKIKREPVHEKILQPDLKIKAEQVGLWFMDDWRYSIWVKQYTKTIGMNVYEWHETASYYRVNNCIITYSEIEQLLLNQHNRTYNKPTSPPAPPFDPFQ